MKKNRFKNLFIIFFSLIFLVGFFLLAKAAPPNTSLLSVPIVFPEFTIDTAIYTKVQDISFGTFHANENVLVKMSYNMEMLNGVGVNDLYMKVVFDEGDAEEQVVFNQKVRSVNIVGENGSIAVPTIAANLDTQGSHKISVYFRRVGESNIRIHNIDFNLGQLHTNGNEDLAIATSSLNFIATGTDFSLSGSISFSKTAAGSIGHILTQTITPVTIDDPDYNATGLEALWRFNGSANDSSGNDRHGTIYGATYNASAGFNDAGAYIFDGTDDYIEIEGYAGISGTNPRTVTAWIKADNANSTITYWGSKTRGERWRFWVEGDGDLRIDTGSKTKRGSTDVDDGQWHFVTVAWEDDGTPTLGDARLYVDGIEEEYTKTADTTFDTDASGSVYIGYSPKGGNYFDGTIDEISIYSRALSAQDVAELYAQSKVRYEMYAEDNNTGERSSVVAGSVGMDLTRSLSNLWIDASSSADVDLSVYTKVANGTLSVTNMHASIEFTDSSSTPSTIQTFNVGNDNTSGLDSVLTYSSGSYRIATATIQIKDGTDVFLLSTVSIRSKSSSIIEPRLYLKNESDILNCTEKVRTLLYYGDVGNIELSCQENGHLVNDVVNYELWLEVPIGAQIDVVDEILIGIEATKYSITQISTAPIVSILTPVQNAHLKGVAGHNITWSTVDNEGHDFTTRVIFDGDDLAVGLASTTSDLDLDLSGVSEGGPYDLVIESCEVSPANHCGTSTNQIYVDNTAPVITIIAPTKSSTTDITDTTIRVTDNQAVNTNNVLLDGSSTADYDLFNCVQTSVSQVDCILDITGTGDLVVVVSDDAGYYATSTETGYQVDSTAPTITITASTKSKSGYITDTTIVVTDDQGISAVSVSIANADTSDATDLSCNQTSSIRVDCTVVIRVSGDLVIRAIDSFLNQSTQTESGYEIAYSSGLPAYVFNLPTPPQNDFFSININNGDEFTYSGEVFIDIVTGADTYWVAFSEDSDIGSVPLIHYEPRLKYSLSPGCGKKTVYAKFYTRYGYGIDPVFDTITLRKKEQSIKASEEVLEEIKDDVLEFEACYDHFFEYLRFGDEGDEVKKLQIFLKDHENFNDLNVSGYFDEQTRRAVIIFQEKYSEYILAPWNIDKGTGFVYKTTIKKINELYCNN